MRVPSAAHPGPDRATCSVSVNASTPVHIRFPTTPADAQKARERFSETPFLMWIAAIAESRGLQHLYLGVEHLFLGLSAHAAGLIDQGRQPGVESHS